jgi:hypothetical protein
MTVLVQVILNPKYYNLITEMMSGQSSRILKNFLAGDFGGEHPFAN